MSRNLADSYEQDSGYVEREGITAEGTVCLKFWEGIAWLEISNKLVSLEFNMHKNGAEKAQSMG